jgi:hypothetical protein
VNIQESEESVEIWKARAVASLPIVEAALRLTKVPFNLKERSCILVPFNDYEKLQNAVDDYLAAAQSSNASQG